MKLKKGDEIIITAGKDKGKKGKIEKVYRDKEKVLLPGLNISKRHVKKRDEKNPGGIIDFSKPVPTASVMFLCPKCGKPSRIGYRITNGKKDRVCKKCNSII